MSGQNVMLLAALALPFLMVGGAGVRTRPLVLAGLIALYVPLALASGFPRQPRREAEATASPARVIAFGAKESRAVPALLLGAGRNTRAPPRSSDRNAPVPITNFGTGGVTAWWPIRSPAASLLTDRFRSRAVARTNLVHGVLDRFSDSPADEALEALAKHFRSDYAHATEPNHDEDCPVAGSDDLPFEEKPISTPQVERAGA